MKYLILIHSNPQFQQRWDALSEAQRADFGHGHLRLRQELIESGELIASAGLADPATGTRVTSQDGETWSADGPFAEAKEHLAGFYLIDCDGRERATAIAARVPDATWGLVEVRPVLTQDDWEL